MPAHDTMPTADDVAAFAAIALQCVHREYPNQLHHHSGADSDLLPPHRLTPAFYGCYDWHSAVHNHWLLVRLARRYPHAAFVPAARAALARSLTPAHIAAEVAYLQAPGRESFERPYGLAWLLQLSAELRQWQDDAEARQWHLALAPLEAIAAQRLCDWLPRLTHPLRSGTHQQTAFALALAFDWAHISSDGDRLRDVVVDCARRFHMHARDAPLAWEPSGEDFLSPCLMEADLMRRILPSANYAQWLGAFLPGIPSHGGTDWLIPAIPSDRADGRLVHLDGLNLSRAWNLHAIAEALPAADARRAALNAAAQTHRAAGLAAVDSGHYAGTHWLASFAVYLVTDKAAEAVRAG